MKFQALHMHMMITQAYMKASEVADEDMVAALSSIYSNRAAGKDLPLDIDTHGLLAQHAGVQEVCVPLRVCLCVLPVCVCVSVAEHGPQQVQGTQCCVASVSHPAFSVASRAVCACVCVCAARAGEHRVSGAGGRAGSCGHSGGAH